jgi:Protein of unknown function (DUF1559)
MSANPYTSPLTPGESPPLKTGHFQSRLITWLVVGAILVTLVALLLPFRRSGVRPAMRRMQCINNLKQIALALKNYADVYHAFPPAYTINAEGKPLHSWRTLILPYIEGQSSHEKIDLSKPWNDPANKAAFESSRPRYRCPEANCPDTHTTYLAVVAPGSCLQPTEPRKLSDITDSRDYTVMVVEVGSDQAVPWMSPSDTSEQWLMNLKNDSRLPHPNVALAVCVSGRTLTVKKNASAEALRALISIAGNDDAIARGEFGKN